MFRAVNLSTSSEGALFTVKVGEQSKNRAASWFVPEPTTLLTVIRALNECDEADSLQRKEKH